MTDPQAITIWITLYKLLVYLCDPNGATMCVSSTSALGNSVSNHMHCVWPKQRNKGLFWLTVSGGFNPQWQESSVVVYVTYNQEAGHAFWNKGQGIPFRGLLLVACFSWFSSTKQVLPPEGSAPSLNRTSNQGKVLRTWTYGRHFRFKPNTLHRSFFLPSVEQLAVKSRKNITLIQL